MACTAPRRARVNARFFSPPTSCSNAKMQAIELALEDLRLDDALNYAYYAKKHGVDQTTLSRRHRQITFSHN